jgi:hypothetical protein
LDGRGLAGDHYRGRSVVCRVPALIELLDHLT